MQKVIDDVPRYTWYRGCGPTAIGTIVGYWADQGWWNLVEGAKSGTAKSSTGAKTPQAKAMIASVNHYESYAKPIDSSSTGVKADKSTLGNAHTDESVADFCGTSRSAMSQVYGWSWFSRIDNGFEEYFELKGYTDANARNVVFDAFNFDDVKAEIDAGRPFCAIIDTNGNGWTDHFIAVIGYDDVTMKFAALNNWDANIHWYKWRKIDDGISFGVYGVTLLDPGPRPVPVYPCPESSSEENEQSSPLEPEPSSPLEVPLMPTPAHRYPLDSVYQCRDVVGYKNGFRTQIQFEDDVMMGNVAHFDGVVSSVDLPANRPVWLPGGDLSIAVRVRVSAPLGKTSYIFDGNHGDSGLPSNELGFSLRISPDGFPQFRMTTTDTDEDLESDYNIADGQWHDIVAVRRGDKQSIYVDGELSCQRVCKVSPIHFVGGYDDYQVHIGRFTRKGGMAGGNFFFRGCLSNLMLYDVGLSAEDVKHVYAEPVIPHPITDRLTINVPANVTMNTIQNQDGSFKITFGGV